MIFRRVYRCRRCDTSFAADKTFDSQKVDPYTQELHVHNCSKNQCGVAESVGFDVVSVVRAPV